VRQLRAVTADLCRQREELLGIVGIQMLMPPLRSAVASSWPWDEGNAGDPSVCFLFCVASSPDLVRNDLRCDWAAKGNYGLVSANVRREDGVVKRRSPGASL